MSLAAGTRLGPYEVLGLIGSGGTGEVYKARDTRLDRTVAIKILPQSLSADSDRRARFEREAKTIAGLNHPHICVLHDIGRERDSDYLVLEFLDGRTLADLFARKGRLSIEQTLNYAIQIAEALSAAHRGGIVHRDLKPDNVMITKAGVKVLDFGLARLTEPVAGGSGTAVVSALGIVAGTAPYMAPEQVQGLAVDARTDIFALGAVLYEMLTGRRAFEGGSPASVMAAVLEHDPPSVASLQPLTPPALDRLVRQCLAKSPDDRWDSAHDVGNELRALHESGGLPTLAPFGPGGARWRAPRWVLAATGLAAVLGAVAALWLLQGSRAVPASVLRAVLDVGPADGLNAGATSLWMSTPGGARTAFAWTPDGRALVFAGQRGEVRQLYVRALDRSEPTPLAGTEGVRAFAISPDGQSVAFWTGGTLKKVPLAGGPVSEIAAGIGADVPLGLTWDGGGNLYFAREDGRIWKVVATTGRLSAVSTNGVGHDTLPSLLPGGEVLLYTVRTQTVGWGGEEVVAQTLATGQRKTLLRDATDARYVSTGHLVFMRRGILHAVAFDVERLTTRGPEVPIIEGVAQALYSAGAQDDVSGAGQFAVASTGALAWVPGEAAGVPLYELVSVDRRGRVTPLAAPQRSYAPRVSLSPDGRRLAVAIHSAAGESAWVYDLVRGTLQLLSNDGEVGWQLWSPDGQQLVYRWRKNGRSFLGGQPADGSAPVHALASEYLAPSSWSPDGRRLAGVTYKSTLDDADLAVATIEHGQARIEILAQTPQMEGWPQFSPDGRWLAYASDVSGRDEVYVRPYPAPGPSMQMSNNGGASPAWSKNGRELLYVGNECRGDRCQGFPTSTTRQMLSVDFEAGSPPQVGTPRALFAFEGQDLAFALSPCRVYDVTPDGERFFVRRRMPLSAMPVVKQINIVQNWFEELKAKVPVR